MYNISYVIVRVFSSKPMPYLFGRFLFSFFLQRLFLITNYCTTIMQVLEFWWSQHSFMLASETSLTFSSANCSNILQFCLYSISNCFVLKIFQKKTKKKKPVCHDWRETLHRCESRRPIPFEWSGTAIIILSNGNPYLFSYHINI